ncbi:hypothetical protein LOK46_10380 [Methylobacterium sp. NMS14P]|uniref:hypothetical protein n=1 Tax=Methylobacterium sp. NMS14P TaxID=2894310 RepID=UPI00235A2799|nr:hypothetical protein [Methylobacterium sp. NMS14P]WCS27195.1 hypothetical protein LOK46_10380 [Methylobacterium sp. NMS14P]
MAIWSPRNGLDNRRPDLAHCRAVVYPKETYGWLHGYQCPRKAIVFRCVEGHEGELGFCRQHDPEAVRARNKARQDRVEAEWARARAKDERERQTRDAQAAAKAALESIAAGHNDPRTLAVEVLAMFPA